MKLSLQPSNTTAQITYKGLHVTDNNTQKLLLENFNPKQLEILSGLMKEEQNNSVHILLGSNRLKRLNAKLLCFYRLQDFKPEYKQQIFESKFHFIERVVNIANEYKQQIKNLEVINLKWNYSILHEWAVKMHLL